MSLKADTLLIVVMLAVGAVWLLRMRFNTGGQKSGSDASAESKSESDQEIGAQGQEKG